MLCLRKSLSRGLCRCAVLAQPKVEIDGDEVRMTAVSGRMYRVLGLDKCTTRGAMRVNVKVSGMNVRGESCYHGDTLDMEAFRQRAMFVKQAAQEIGDQGRGDPSRSGPTVDGAGRSATRADT